MNTETAVQPFPVMLVFPDVEPPVLVRDEGFTLDARSLLNGVWTEYMLRVLPPLAGRQGRGKDLARAGLVWGGSDRGRRV